MVASPSVSRRWLLLGGVAVLLLATAGAAMLAGSLPTSAKASPDAASSGFVAAGSSLTRTTLVGSSPVQSAASAPVATVSAGPTFQPIGLLTTPSLPPAQGGQPTDPGFGFSALRPTPVQSVEWLTEKAAGRIVLVDGRLTLLGEGAQPMAVTGSGALLPDAWTLDTSWTRWVVEPPGSGRDEKGNYYANLNYWNLCSAGATTVALYYWQRLAGYPDVTGTAGYFLEPYVAETGGWPSSGPTVATAPDGSRLGTYWSGTDTVSGFAANGRGFLMYLATQTRPATWSTTGMVVYSDASGRPLYPTRGGSRTQIMVAFNWEASGRDGRSWIQTWYTSVTRADPQLARDLAAAVTLDVGRDGLPVVAAGDTYGLPNWQDGSATPHIRHAVSIVGYDNAANPPTFTYVDTCGRACNARGGNENGQLHVISQADMVAAINDSVGSGFDW